MKLALFISSLRSGGAERVLSDLANHWAKNGHDVHMITFASPDEVPFYTLGKNIRLHSLNLLDDNASSVKRILNIIRRLYVIRRTVRALAPDRILSFIDITNITVLIATMGLNIPVVVSERTDPNFHYISNFYNKLRHIFYGFAQNIIVQTRSAASFFKSQSVIKIIPNSVQKSQQLINYDRPLTKLISVGRLVKSKNFSILIKCFSHVYIGFPDLTLTIYGDGPERENLERLIRKLNLEDRIFLPGAVKNIHEKLIEADLFVFPSRYEGFPNALCEAMAVGLPVIASNCSGNIDVIEDGINGILFPVEDEIALINHMKMLCNDASLRQKLGEKAKEITQTYSPEKIYTLWDKIVIK